MLNHTKRALMAGALTLAGTLAGCAGDHAGGATGPGVPAARAARNGAALGADTARIAVPQPVVPGRGGTGGYDRAVSPLNAVGPDGKLYEVRFVIDATGAVVATQHLQDGRLFAQTGGLVEDAGSMAVYGDLGLIMQDLSVTAAATAMAAAASRTTQDPGRPVSGPRPMRMAAFNPCDSEWRAYGEASIGLIAAGAFYSAYRNTTTLNALRVAAGTFLLAWYDLYSCIDANP